MSIWAFDTAGESTQRFLVFEKVDRLARRYLVASKDVRFAFDSLLVIDD